MRSEGFLLNIERKKKERRGNPMASASNYITAFIPAGIDGGRHQLQHNRLPRFNCNSRNCKRFIHMTAAAAAAKKGVGEASGSKIFKFGIKKNEEEENEEEEEDEDEEEQGPVAQVIEAWKKFSEGAGVNSGALVPIANVFGSRLSNGSSKRRDPNMVFVAGATGQTGARISQKLLRQGLNVRGGVRDIYVAQQLAEFATQYGIISREEAKRLNAVEFDYKNVESIAKAIGAATQVVVTIGPTEDGPKSNVSFEDASNVIDAAKLANITNLVVIYEPTGATVGSGDVSLAGIASFFTGLFNKPVAVSLSEILDKIVDSELSYTLIKTALTEGVDDDDTSLQVIDLQKLEFGSITTSGLETKISKAQVAEVVAEVLLNPSFAGNKVIEVLTSTVAEEQRPISELLSGIPVDGRRAALLEARAEAEREVRDRETREAAEAEAREAAEEARRASQLVAQLEAEAKRLGAEELRLKSVAEKAQAKATAAAASVDSLASKIKEMAGASPPPGLPSLELANFNIFARRADTPPLPSTGSKAEKPTRPTVSPKPQKPKAFKTSTTPSAPSTPTPSSKPQRNSIFGGLFTQETVYVDEV